MTSLISVSYTHLDVYKRQIRAIVINDGSLIPLPSSDAQIKIAGIVKIAPAANDSPAEPIV